MNSQIAVVFDLDYTLLNGDCENEWTRFMFEHGIVNQAFVDKIAEFYQDYENGRLDGVPYEEFLLRPLAENPPEKMLGIRDAYLETIQKLVRPQMTARIARHRARDHVLLLMSSSNSFLVEPIARMLGFSQVICTRVEIKNGFYTGQLQDVPPLKEMKVTRLQAWLNRNALSLQGSWGYGDSINDLPYLSLVENPVAVTPDAKLRQAAIENHWEILDL